MSQLSSSESDSTGLAENSETLSELFAKHGWVRKEVYEGTPGSNGSDGAIAGKICDQILFVGFHGDPDHQWSTEMKERGLSTSRQWSGIPGSCAALELILDYPMEWLRSKWGRAFYLRRLTK